MGVVTALIRDVVIVVPGIMGSALVARDGRTLWDVSPGGLVRAIRGLQHDSLTLPRDTGDGPAPDGVRPTRLVDSLHVIPGVWSPITGYDGLMRFLRSPRFQFVEADSAEPDRIPNLLTFPYDWRLSCRHNGSLLARLALPALEAWRAQPGMGDAKLVLICHSMGGLVARWFADREAGAPHIRALVTLGTPHRGALKALDALVNGLEPSWGPLRVSMSALARSLPSLHELLPRYACLEGPDGVRRTVEASSCPGVDAALWHMAGRFHEGLQAAPAYPLHKVVGIRQPTATTARWVGDVLEPSEFIDGWAQGGDGTVPRLAAEPETGRGLEVHEVAAQHGELQAQQSVFDLVDGILTREQVIWQSTPTQNLGLRMADCWRTDERPRLQIEAMPDRRLLATVFDERGGVAAAARPIPDDGSLDWPPLPEGGYRVCVRGARESSEVAYKGFVVMEPR